MTATAHALVAGAIASKFSDPLTASVLSFISHFVMDTVPHWDVGTNWRSRSKLTTGIFALAETFAGISLAYFFFSQKAPLPTLTLSIVASILPDWLETPWYIFFANQKKHKPGKRASAIERLAFRIYKLENVFHTKAQYPLGVATQIGVVAFFLLLLS